MPRPVVIKECLRRRLSLILAFSQTHIFLFFFLFLFLSQQGRSVAYRLLRRREFGTRDGHSCCQRFCSHQPHYFEAVQLPQLQRDPASLGCRLSGRDRPERREKEQRLAEKDFELLQRDFSAASRLERFECSCKGLLPAYKHQHHCKANFQSQL